MAKPGEGEQSQTSGRPDEPERYPAVRQDDAVERTGRTEQVAGEDPSDDAPPEDARRRGFEGPQADPAEGKR
jgi:hypothetical protein